MVLPLFTSLLSHHLCIRVSHSQPVLHEGSEHEAEIAAADEGGESEGREYQHVHLLACRLQHH